MNPYRPYRYEPRVRKRRPKQYPVMKTGMTNWATFSEKAFEFLVTPEILATASLLSLLMGLVGGVLPAFRAARMKVVDALRRA